MSTYALGIADMADAIIRANLRTAFRTFVRTPLLQMNPDDLPVCGVYILREKRAPDGDANAREARFIHELTLGFSGAVNIDTQKREEVMRTLEETMASIDDLVLKNIPFMRLIEGVIGMDRVSQYSKMAETTLGEIRVEMTVTYRSEFTPDVPDDFLVLHVETQYPDKAHVDSGTQQITVVHDIEQN